MDDTNEKQVTTIRVSKDTRDRVKRIGARMLLLGRQSDDMESVVAFMCDRAEIWLNQYSVTLQ